MEQGTVSRSWFAVFPNPEQHGYFGTPEEICEQLKKEWIGDNSLRKGWWGYCISPKGMPHIHMVLEGSGAMRFSANGKEPVLEYLEELASKNDKDSRIKLNKIRDYMKILKENGTRAGEPYVKHIEGEIWELNR